MKRDNDRSVVNREKTNMITQKHRITQAYISGEITKDQYIVLMRQKSAPVKEHPSWEELIGKK